MHELVIVVAKYFIALSVLVTIVVWLFLNKNDKKILVVQLISGGIIALIIAYIARHFYNDPRPFVEGHFKPYFPHAADNGFISDHTLLASFLAFSVYFYKKWVGLLLIILAIVIGTARVIAGVHHWRDILAAFIVSFIASLLALAITHHLKPKKRYKKP